MDSGKVFVLVMVVLIIGLLAYLELKSRRTARQSEVSVGPTDERIKKT